MRQPPAQPALLRELNERAVLDALRAARIASRAELAAAVGVSPPTVAGALRSLVEAGLARQAGRRSGRRGRVADLYEAVAEAALVAGVDVGSRNVRGVLVDLAGAMCAEAVIDARSADADGLQGAVAELRRRLWGGVGSRAPLLAVVGCPGVVDPASGRIDLAGRIPGWNGLVATVAIAHHLGVPARVENDVNLAALAEREAGAGRGVDSFIYLSIGTGVGAGIVLSGRLHRGQHGAAGEVAYLPLGESPERAGATSGGAAEQLIGAAAIDELARRAGVTGGAAGAIAAARRGDRAGRDVVDELTRRIARVIAAMTAVVDVDLVILGGSIGTHTDLLLAPVASHISQLVPYPPRVVPSELGTAAVVAGATALARQDADRLLFEQRLVTPRAGGGSTP